MSSYLPSVSEWILTHGVAILVIIVVAVTVHLIGGLFVERIIRKLVSGHNFRSKAAEQKREDTLIRIVRGTLKVVIWIMATLMILSEIGIDIGPLLAAAGVAGLAIGFGGQYLIRDVVAGLFIILENQYRVGDVIGLDGTCGLVEDISIRMVKIRDLDGTVHHIPHGVVSKVSNLSKDFARVNLDIGISYRADLETVIRVINEVGQGMADDPYWKPSIIKPMQFARVNDFADSAVMIKILGDTEPLKQWDVAGEYRKRLKIAFDQNGIDIPFPQRVIHTV